MKKKFKEENETYQFKKKLMEMGVGDKQIEKITQAFWYYYLAGNPSMEMCSDCMKAWIAKMHPELLGAYVAAEPELKRFF